MILNENQFFHLNFYSSWCNIAFNEHFKVTKILIWKELFCPVAAYYMCRPIRRFFTTGTYQLNQNYPKLN